MPNKILKVMVHPLKDGKLSIDVYASTPEGKTAFIAGTPITADKIASQLNRIANELDLSAWPYDQPGATTPLGMV